MAPAVATYVGVDVGAKRLHAVAIDEPGSVVDAAVLDANAGALVDWATSARVVAIDAPSALSRAPHATDTGLRPKFQRARCAEIALGRQHRVWVPWATPEAEEPGWMTVGIALFKELEAAGIDAIEVYPYAGFRVLAGPRLESKRTRAGIVRRAELLRAAGIDAPFLEAWSHDALDALLGAVIARDHARGRATPVTCGHDGSAIWLPSIGL